MPVKKNLIFSILCVKMSDQIQMEQYIRSTLLSHLTPDGVDELIRSMNLVYCLHNKQEFSEFVYPPVIDLIYKVLNEIYEDIAEFYN